MNTIANKHVMIIGLQMRYAHLRAHKALEKLTTSIEHYGQLVSVVVVPMAHHLWILIDGSQRVKALKRLGKDTVEAKVWHCNITEALIMLLKGSSSHRPGTLEEAFLLHELYTQHNLSQQALATRGGPPPILRMEYEDFILMLKALWAESHFLLTSVA